MDDTKTDDPTDYDALNKDNSIENMSTVEWISELIKSENLSTGEIQKIQDMLEKKWTIQMQKECKDKAEAATKKFFDKMYDIINKEIDDQKTSNQTQCYHQKQ